MVDITAEQALAILNGISLLMFTALVGSGLFGILRRVILYRRAKALVPVIMRRDIALLGSLAIIGTESLVLRALNVVFEGWARVGFIAHYNLILLVALGYWVKVELWDVDDPDKP